MDVYKRQFEVNTFGTVRSTRAFLPLLRKVNGSRVVLIASIAGRVVTGCLTAYAMSKHAVRAFGDGLRRELKKEAKVQVSVIEPTVFR